MIGCSEVEQYCVGIWLGAGIMFNGGPSLTVEKTRLLGVRDLVLDLNECLPIDWLGCLPWVFVFNSIFSFLSSVLIHFVCLGFVFSSYSFWFRLGQSYESVEVPRK